MGLLPPWIAVRVMAKRSPHAGHVPALQAQAVDPCCAGSTGEPRAHAVAEELARCPLVYVGVERPACMGHVTGWRPARLIIIGAPHTRVALHDQDSHGDNAGQLLRRTEVPTMAMVRHTADMAAWQLRRLGVVMEPNMADVHEVGGVLNPAVARGPDGHLYLLPRLVAAGNYSRIGLSRVLFNRHHEPVRVERLGVVL